MPVWRPSISQKAAAGRAAAELFKFCEMPDVGDPESFLAAAILILAEFPNEVMQAVAHPAHGLPSRMRRPGLSDIRAACDAFYAPIARREKRDKIAAEQAARLAAPSSGEPLRLEEIRAKFGCSVLGVDAHEAFPDGDLKAHKIDDPAEAKRLAALDSKAAEESSNTILREYARLGIDPIYAGLGLLVSPSLVKLIKETSPAKALQSGRSE